MALNAKTGQRYPDFGTDGYVDLTKGLDRPIEGYRWGGPPLVVGDVLYTVSDAGVKASSLATFAGLGFVALPAGDVRSGSLKRCATAVGEGAMVVRFVHDRIAVHSKTRL